MKDLSSSYRTKDRSAQTLHIDTAKDFLQRTATKLRITLSDSKTARWTPAGHHYRITLSKKARRLTFDYWGSAHDAEHEKEPTEYSVLSCIAGDIQTPDTFEEFCSEYGSSPDSIEALQTFKRTDRFAKRLREFFTPEEINELSTIR